MVYVADTTQENGETLYLDTACVYELGNGEVLFGGTAVSVENDIPNNFFEVGFTYFFRAIDNGQGKNAPSDVAFIANIRAELSCDDPDLIAFFDLFPQFYLDIGNNSANMQSPYGVKVN